MRYINIIEKYLKFKVFGTNWVVCDCGNFTPHSALGFSYLNNLPFNNLEVIQNGRT